MAKGGARTRSGPPPDPNALRRERDTGEWIELPAAGRVGARPRWPLSAADAAERRLWSELWTMPQAIIWERQRQFLEVALYVRRLREAERRDSSVALSTLVRQTADSLGLTTPGLRSHRWKIVVDTVPGRSVAPSSVRDRLRMVPDAGG